MLRGAALAFVATAAFAALVMATAPALPSPIPMSRPLDAAVVLVQALLGAAFLLRHRDAWVRHRAIVVGLGAVAAAALLSGLVAWASPAALGSIRPTPLVWGLLAVSWTAGLLAAAGIFLVARAIRVAATGGRWPRLAVVVLVASVVALVQMVADVSRVVSIGTGGAGTLAWIGGAVVGILNLAAWTWLGIVAAPRRQAGGVLARGASPVAGAALLTTATFWLIPLIILVVSPLGGWIVVLRAVFALGSAGLLLVAFGRGLPGHDGVTG